MVGQSDIGKLLEKFYLVRTKVGAIKSSIEILGWDRDRFIPEAGQTFRARQIKTLVELEASLLKDADYACALARLIEVSPNLSTVDRFNVERAWNEYRRLIKLPDEFLSRKAAVISTCSGLWIQALTAGWRFADIGEPFSQMVALWQEEAELAGFATHPYDAHLELYHPGLTTSDVRQFLEALIVNISISEGREDCTRRKIKVDKDHQESIIRHLLRKLSFSADWGRVDAGFPCTVPGGPADTRISVRFDAEDFVTLLSDSMHEFGHAIYNRDLPHKHFGSPLGSAPSVSMQECIARFFENHISKSAAFCEHLEREAESVIGKKTFTAAELLAHQRTMKITPDRVQADEATYHLHIYIRFLLEEQLVSGTLKIEEIPELWNALYVKYLGVRPKDDREGVLQEASWFYGTPGYFPCYSMGSYYAFILFKIVSEAVTNLEAELLGGDFARLIAWLGENVFSKGGRFQFDKLPGYRGHNEHFEQYAKYLRDCCAGTTPQRP